MSSEAPSLYRQTTENIGTYRPLQKSTYRTHYIVPSTNCATKKIIPANTQFLPYEISKALNENGTNDIFKNSTSLPRLKNYISNSSRESLHKTPESSTNTNSSLKLDQISNRPYTPPEKRYSANFGMRLPERKNNNNKPRPKTSFIYENVHARENFCANNECNMGKVKSDRILNNVANVKVTNFPTPAFNSMYIQENRN